MKYKYILFDLDGTLTDPKEGITKSIQYALRKYNIFVEDLDSLEKFIGPPLRDSFSEFYGFSIDKAAEAVEFYREYYRSKGIFQNIVYPGIEDALKVLKLEGCILITATTKPTLFAEQILEHFGLKQYFSAVVGSNLDGTRSRKGDIIKYIIETFNIKSTTEMVMIGDRKYDMEGARENGIHSIGVTYGYGTLQELQQSSPTYIAENAKDIVKLILM